MCTHNVQLYSFTPKSFVKCEWVELMPMYILHFKTDFSLVFSHCTVFFNCNDSFIYVCICRFGLSYCILCFVHIKFILQPSLYLPLSLSSQIILHSLHRYQPRLHVIEARDVLMWGGGRHSFVFPETQFYTVTAYQNSKVRLEQAVQCCST